MFTKTHKLHQKGLFASGNENFRIFTDNKAKAMDWIYINAGKRGIFLGCSPQDLATLFEAEFEDIA